MMASAATPRTWAILAAAGQGRRMDAERPKQYLELAGATVLEHALRPLLSHPQISGIVVVLAPGDEFWPQLPLATAPRVMTTLGGDARQHSVLNGLMALGGKVSAEDWILVHDGARPCLQREALDMLMAAVKNDQVGGLLAVPLGDTLKRADADGLRCESTLERKGLWCAQTPQMFRYGLLHVALGKALAEGTRVTDEAQAVEALGHRPQLVRGSPHNIKITHREDLVLAEALLRRAAVR
jgi:2-C-methyl-D-erythritol 4-phosphate cytidylyltransferase